MSISPDNAEKHILQLTLSTYVGQEDIKRHLRWLIDVAGNYLSETLLPPLLLCGPPEMGKATLAHTIAHELGVGISHTSSGVLRRPGDLSAILTNLDSRGVVLVEQIEALRPAVLNSLLEAIEDWMMTLEIGQGAEKRILHLELPHFTLIGTTTNLSQIDPRLRRWLIAYEFLPYSVDLISQLIQLLGQQQQIIVPDSTARLLADHCEGSPGNAKVLLKKACRYSGNVALISDRTAKDALYFFRYLNLDPLASQRDFRGREK